MKLGVFTVLFGTKPFEEMLDFVVELGLEAVEIGTGAYPGNTYCNPATLLGDGKQLQAFRDVIQSRGLVISALSCHGNPLHPDASKARADHDVFVQTVELARRLDDCRGWLRKDATGPEFASAIRTALDAHAPSSGIGTLPMVGIAIACVIALALVAYLVWLAVY